MFLKEGKLAEDLLAHIQYNKGLDEHSILVETCTLIQKKQNKDKANP